MPRDRGPSLKKIHDALDLAKITSVLRPCYRKWERGDGKTGRPPVNPVALTITLLFSLLRGWHRNDLIAFLERHEEWRRWLRLEFVPDDTTWSKFLDRIGEKQLEKLFQALVQDLHEKKVIRLHVTAVDGSFLPGCHWDKDSEWGYVRKNDKRDLPEGSFLINEERTLLGKGYRVHAIVDADSQLPVAIHLTTANVNDSTAWKDLFEASKEHVDWEHVGWLTGDKGYDTGPVRTSTKNFSVRLAIPAANTPDRLPRVGLKGQAKKIYKKRTSVERFFALLKRFFALRKWGITGLKHVRRWILLAACAVLMLACWNRSLGLPLGSLKGLKRTFL